MNESRAGFQAVVDRFILLQIDRFERFQDID